MFKHGEVREFYQKSNHEILCNVLCVVADSLHFSKQAILSPVHLFTCSPCWQLLAVRSGTYDINGKAWHFAVLLCLHNGFSSQGSRTQIWYEVNNWKHWGWTLRLWFFLVLIQDSYDNLLFWVRWFWRFKLVCVDSRFCIGCCCAQIFALGKQATAPPKQAARGHWLTQAMPIFFGDFSASQVWLPEVSGK